MKRIGTTIIFSLTILSTSASRAEQVAEHEEPRQAETQARDFHPDIFPHLFLQPAYMFLELNLHEGSHALTALALGQEVTAYKPYPHYEDVGGERVFYFGSTLVSNEGRTSREDALIAIAPTVADMTVFVAADITLSNMEPGSRVAPFIFFGGMVWPLVDFITNINSFDPTSDVSRWSENARVNRYAVAIAGDVLGVVGFWRIVEHSVNVLLVAKATNPNKALLLVQPVVTSDGATFVFAGRF